MISMNVPAFVALSTMRGGGSGSGGCDESTKASNAFFWAMMLFMAMPIGATIAMAICFWLL